MDPQMEENEEQGAPGCSQPEVLSLRGRDVARPVQCRKCQKLTSKIEDLTSKNEDLEKERNELLAQLQVQFSNEGNLLERLEQQAKSHETAMSMVMSWETEAGGSPSPTDGVLIPNCTICFEDWESSGPHRMVSLRCGHLFGASCICEYLERGMANCPVCRGHVDCGDIRLIHI